MMKNEEKIKKIICDSIIKMLQDLDKVPNNITNNYINQNKRRVFTLYSNKKFNLYGK